MRKPRARDLGVPFEGVTGQNNAITDVDGLMVGYTTLIHGADVRTGVTAILPMGHGGMFTRVPGAVFSLNGNGEMTGFHWVEESGMVDGPIMLTNTHSVGLVRDATIQYLHNHPVNQRGANEFFLPVVSETYDGVLNDINGHHVTSDHVVAAITSANSGPVEEGSVGSGTGMITHRWKGGMGTSSRLVAVNGKTYTVGVLVQSNYGERHQLRIAGIPIGKAIDDLMPEIPFYKDGSIVVIIATDAPFLPHQLKRLARRATMGLARVGSVAMDSSGDIFLALSTHVPQLNDGLESWCAIPYGAEISGFFEAVVDATEESIVNALVAGETMVGYRGAKVHGLPHDRLQALIKSKLSL
jgi:D-aminopeptidase